MEKYGSVQAAARTSLIRKAGKIKHLSQKAGLSNNNVEYLFQNTEDEIWVGTREKVNIIDRKKNTLKQLGREQGLSNDNIISIFKDGDGRIWIGNLGDQVDVVDADKNQIRRIGARDGLSGRYVPSMLRRGDGNIWIVTSAGINIIQERGGVRYLKDKKSTNDRFKLIWGLMEDSKGQVWVGNDEGFFIIDPTLESAKFIKLGYRYILFWKMGWENLDRSTQSVFTYLTLRVRY